MIEAYKSFNKFFKFFDAASVMKASVCSHKLAAVTIFPLTMVAAVARRSYVSIKRLAICFWSSNAKNMGLCLKVYPSIGKAWNQTRPFSINRVPCCWIIMEDDFQISLFIQHGQWCITFHLRCLQVFKISICSQLWQNIFIIGILLFWVWMLSSFCWWLWCMSISFWLAINTKIKIMTIEGTACCFDSNSGHFNRYATLCWYLCLSRFYLVRAVPITANFRLIDIAVISLKQ